jgi:hypothetical protein
LIRAAVYGLCYGFLVKRTAFAPSNRMAIVDNGSLSAVAVADGFYFTFHPLKLG